MYITLLLSETTTLIIFYHFRAEWDAVTILPVMITSSDFNFPFEYAFFIEGII